VAGVIAPLIILSVTAVWRYCFSSVTVSASQITDCFSNEILRTVTVSASQLFQHHNYFNITTISVSQTTDCFSNSTCILFNCFSIANHILFQQRDLRTV
jgi:hypothetical protein